MKTHIKMLLAVAAVATAQVVGANTLTVPGTADPWLATGGIDTYGGDPNNTDVSTGVDLNGLINEAPVFAGSVTAGSTISWSATGSTGNTPNPPAGNGPNGDPSLATYVATPSGGGQVIAPITAPINSLIGVWTGGGGFTDYAFEMGASGTAVVPVGATGLDLGSMDGFQWNNNVGAFTVNVGVGNVPDGGLTAGLLGSALLGLGALRRKLSV